MAEHLGNGDIVHLMLGHLTEWFVERAFEHCRQCSCCKEAVKRYLDQLEQEMNARPDHYVYAFDYIYTPYGLVEPPWAKNLARRLRLLG
jgi:hypothetical protein